MQRSERFVAREISAPASTYPCLLLANGRAGKEKGALPVLRGMSGAGLQHGCLTAQRGFGCLLAVGVCPLPVTETVRRDQVMFQFCSGGLATLVSLLCAGVSCVY